MTRTKPVIAVLLAVTLCCSSICPALAAETYGEDKSVEADNEQLESETQTKEEEIPASGHAYEFRGFTWTGSDEEG